MLPDPPCIKRLVGCSGNTYTDGNGDSSPNNNANGNNGTSNLNTNQQGNNSSLSFDALLASVKNRVKVDNFAVYTLLIKNTRSQALKDVSVVHGPIPFNATFDNSQSSSECLQMGKDIQCKIINLEGGETITKIIAYKTGGTFRCLYAKILEKAKTVLANAEGTNPLSVSVTCTMKTSDELVAMKRENEVSTSKKTGELNTYKSLSGSYKDTGYKTTYKPYAVDLLPQTGAENMYYAGSVAGDVLLYTLQKKQEGSPSNHSLFFGMIFFFMICAIFLKKSGLKLREAQ